MNAIHTSDYPRKTIREMWGAFAFAAGFGLLVAVLLLLLSLCGPAWKPGAALLLSCAAASGMFSMGYYYAQEGNYYMASIPIDGVARGLFFVFTWIIWIPLLISLFRMRRAMQKNTEQDRLYQDALRLEAEGYRAINTEGHFPKEVCARLADYCTAQASIHDVEMTTEEAQVRVERIKALDNTLEFYPWEAGELVLEVHAKGTQDGKAYDLGIFTMRLTAEGGFSLAIFRTGRLENELPMKRSLDVELLRYVKTVAEEITWRIRAGQVDVAVEKVAQMLNDNHCIEARPGYRVSEHYHLAEM